MKTASVRDLRQNFQAVLAWIREGEEVAITLRRKAVARLVPLSRRKKGRRQMPDIKPRLWKVFGSKVIADKPIKAILDHNKGTS